jgi:hypothetical protein
MLRLAPDGDQKQPGNLLTVSNLQPTTRGGYRPAYARNDSAYTALPAACVGAAFITKPDNTNRLFAGTATRVYEYDQGSGTNITDRSSTTYSGLTSSGWMFCQFADNTIKVNRGFQTEVSTTAAFGALSGSPPKANICLVQSNAVWLFNIDDGTSKPDAYRISDQGVHTTWTPAASNEAFEGRLYDTDGPITAAIPFQNGALAFKQKGMWFIEYVGRPDIYIARMISPEHGCVGPRALCVAEGVVYFYSDRGIYRYSGSYPELISEEINSLAFAGGILGPDLLSSIAATHDEANKTIKFYRLFSGGVYGGWMRYNYKSGTWGIHDTVDSGETVEMPIQTTIAKMYSFPGVSAAIPASATGWTSDFAISDLHKLVNFNNATSKSCQIRTWMTGAQNTVNKITRIFIEFFKPPVTTSVSGSATGYKHCNPSGTQMSTAAFSGLDTNDALSAVVNGRWIQGVITFDATAGAFEIANVYFDPPPSGKAASKS